MTVISVKEFVTINFYSIIEFVDHLHEHFMDPCIITNASYMAPKVKKY